MLFVRLLLTEQTDKISRTRKMRSWADRSEVEKREREREESGGSGEPVICWLSKDLWANEARERAGWKSATREGVDNATTGSLSIRVRKDKGMNDWVLVMKQKKEKELLSCSCTRRPEVRCQEGPMRLSRLGRLHLNSPANKDGARVKGRGH